MPNPAVTNDDAKRQFLEEGARSFVAARSAILAYQGEVQKICKQVLTRHLGQLSQAVGVDFATSPVRDWLAPGDEKWPGQDTYLGAVIGRNDPSFGIAGWETYCALNWSYEETERWFGGWVGAWLPRKIATELHRQLQPLRPDVQISNRSVWIDRKLNPANASTIENDLGELLIQWIELWKKVGGLQALKE